MVLFFYQVDELLKQRYLKKKYICPILIFFHADRHINNKKTNRKSFYARYNNAPGMQKMTQTRNGKNHFSKALSMPFDKFWFLNFVDLSIEKFAGINFDIAVTQTLYF